MGSANSSFPFRRLLLIIPVFLIFFFLGVIAFYFLSTKSNFLTFKKTEVAPTPTPPPFSGNLVSDPMQGVYLKRPVEGGKGIDYFVKGNFLGAAEAKIDGHEVVVVDFQQNEILEKEFQIFLPKGLESKGSIIYKADDLIDKDYNLLFLRLRYKGEDFHIENLFEWQFLAGLND